MERVYTRKMGGNSSLTLYGRVIDVLVVYTIYMRFSDIPKETGHFWDKVCSAAATEHRVPNQHPQSSESLAVV